MVKINKSLMSVNAIREHHRNFKINFIQLLGCKKVIDNQVEYDVNENVKINS